MKKIVAVFALSAVLFSCNNENEKGKFVLNADVKNVPDQSVYLEQLFFNQQDPQVLDTAKIKAGKFSVSGIAAEEGLYRIRFEKISSGFIFINDNRSLILMQTLRMQAWKGQTLTARPTGH